MATLDVQLPSQKSMVFRSMKRTADMFVGNVDLAPEINETRYVADRTGRNGNFAAERADGEKCWLVGHSRSIKIKTKIGLEYLQVKHLDAPRIPSQVEEKAESAKGELVLYKPDASYVDCMWKGSHVRNRLMY